jgi:hypothetical protein
LLLLPLLRGEFQAIRLKGQTFFQLLFGLLQLLFGLLKKLYFLLKCNIVICLGLESTAQVVYGRLAFGELCVDIGEVCVFIVE